MPRPPPFLVVAPTSVVSNWAAEAARFAPGLRVTTVGATQAASGRRIADVAAARRHRRHDLRAPAPRRRRVRRARLGGARARRGAVREERRVEGQRRGTRHPCALQARGHRHARREQPDGAVGAPEDRRAGAVPVGAARSPSATGGRSRTTTTPSGCARLRRRIRPLVLRRTKELVAPELPEKQEQVLTVALDPSHRRSTTRSCSASGRSCSGCIDDLDRNRFIVFRSLTLLRMLSLARRPHRRRAVRRGAVGEARRAASSSSTRCIAEGHRALVFSQFTSFLGARGGAAGCRRRALRVPRRLDAGAAATR